MHRDVSNAPLYLRSIAKCIYLANMFRHLTECYWEREREAGLFHTVTAAFASTIDLPGGWPE